MRNGRRQNSVRRTRDYDPPLYQKFSLIDKCSVMEDTGENYSM